MWAAVLYIGLVMATDPIRMGLALVLVTRKRPAMNLLAFWVGGIVAGFAVATVALVLARDIAIPVIQAGVSTFAELRSNIVILSGGRLHITLGVIALLAVLVLSARHRAREKTLVEVGAGGTGDSGGGSAVAVQPRPTTPIARMGARAHEMLNNQDVAKYGALVPAFVVGLASSAPPIETVTSLTIIMASKAAIFAQFSAFLVFILLVLTVVEIPLVGYLVMPQRTHALMMRVQDWVAVYGRKLTQGLLVVMGLVGVVHGLMCL
jgi:hypothetical protein